MRPQLATIVLCSILHNVTAACSKHNLEEVAPLPSAKYALYKSELQKQTDKYGLIRMGDSVGDSAIFSCLGRAAGVLSFDVDLLFDNGKPIRHPDIYDYPGIGSPISKDQMSGILWCLLTHEDKAEALRLATAWIDYGKAHSSGTYWTFCDKTDVEIFGLTPARVVGLCIAPAPLIADIYRVAVKLGYDCDTTCKVFTATGHNYFFDALGFERHLIVLSVLRNGVIRGGVYDFDLLALRLAANSNDENALYQAAYALFTDGEMAKAQETLGNISYFPDDGLPTDSNYCTDYLFQRDKWDTRDDGARVLNDDWLPCPGRNAKAGRGIDYVFAFRVSQGF